jgi:CCAAT-binding transcription factor (CBF-B/NF-YA) subunit B
MDVPAMENESDGHFPFYQQDLFTHNIDEEPLYVNAKQYFRILKRRVARTRLEELHRLSRQRKVRLLFSILPSFFAYFSSALST